MIKLKNILTRQKGIWLVLILFAFLLRFHKLGEIPLGINWDEANNGYTAYSLLKTGKDEWGASWPLFTKAFGEYKSTIYASLTTIPINIFGFNNFAVRFIGAFFSCLVVISFYFLVKNILLYFKWNQNKSTQVALLSSVFLAFNPWFFFFSRYAFNPMTSLSFLIFSLTFLFVFLNNRKQYWFLFMAVFMSALSVYGYHSARLVAPLLWLYIGLKEWRFFWKSKKISVIIALLVIILSIPFILSIKKGYVTRRAYQVSLFHNEGMKQEFNTYFAEAAWQRAGLERIFENPKIFYTQKVISNILANLSFDFLFNAQVDNYRMGTGRAGRFFYFDLFLIAGGLYFLFRKSKKLLLFIVYMIVVSVLPSALTVESPHAVRSLQSVFWLVLLTGIGTFFILSYLGRKKWLICILSTIYLLSIVFFLRDYFVHFSFKSGGDWQADYRNPITYIASIQNNYDKVFFDSQLGQPYIFLFYYQQTDPESVQAYVKANDVHEIPFSAMDRYKQFYFWPATSNDWEQKNTLIISRKELSGPNLELLKVFTDKQNNTSFYIYETV